MGLDHLALTVGSRAELEAAAQRLAAAGVEHGEVTDLPSFGVTILSVQDPDGIDLELSAPLEPRARTCPGGSEDDGEPPAGPAPGPAGALGC